MQATTWAIATNAGISFGETYTYKTLGILKIGEVEDVWFDPDDNRVVAITKGGSVICTNCIGQKPPKNTNQSIYDNITFTVLHGELSNETEE